jgi:DNA-directed RNA polymerase specialized sigma24 family protein
MRAEIPPRGELWQTPPAFRAHHHRARHFADDNRMQPRGTLPQRARAAAIALWRGQERFAAWALRRHGGRFDSFDDAIQELALAALEGRRNPACGLDSAANRRQLVTGERYRVFADGRSECRRRRLVLKEEITAASPPSQESSAEALLAIRRMKPWCQEIALLFAAGFTGREIGAALGIKVSTVYKRASSMAAETKGAAPLVGGQE